MSERVLYIDPGTTSGLALFEFVGSGKRLVYVNTMPGLDPALMRPVLEAAYLDRVVLEDQFFGLPRKGLKVLLQSRFFWEATALILSLPVTVVMPRVWQAAAGLGEKMTTKKRKETTIQLVADTYFQGNRKALSEHCCDAAAIGLADTGHHYVKV